MSGEKVSTKVCLREEKEKLSDRQVKRLREREMEQEYLFLFATRVTGLFIYFDFFFFAITENSSHPFLSYRRPALPRIHKLMVS